MVFRLRLCFSREVEKKENLTWHHNGTVSYRRVKFWYFERDMSVGPLTDRVITINVPVVGAAEFGNGDFLWNGAFQTCSLVLRLEWSS